MIVYLHGFRSSPDSFKARVLAADMEKRGLMTHWRCPALPASPAQALALAGQEAQALAQMHGKPVSAITVMGSSLGGFYATCLAQQLDCKAILLNPAVYAPRDLATQVGEHVDYHHGQPFVFLPQYVDELTDMAVHRITKPERYFLIAATGDEVLDWQEMEAFFEGARQRIVQGSDHGLSDFSTYLPEVLAFAGITPAGIQ